MIHSCASCMPASLSIAHWLQSNAAFCLLINLALHGSARYLPTDDAAGAGQQRYLSYVEDPSSCRSVFHDEGIGHPFHTALLLTVLRRLWRDDIVMELGTAVGIASLGIQVCEGLITYYNSCKEYRSDITNAHNAIADLCNTLILLRETLKRPELDQERKERVERCLVACEDSLQRLSSKLQKLRKHDISDGYRQKAFSGVQNASYPFRASTLAKLREIVGDARERLILTVQVLDLDTNLKSQISIGQLAVDTKAIATSASIIEAQSQSMLKLQLSDQYDKILQWLSPPDPWTNHCHARERHEPATGAWLLQSPRYQSWKLGTTQCLWVHGKPGCGKTVLSSTAIEDTKTYCTTLPNVGCAFFYFSFSDQNKQSRADLSRSLVNQLGFKQPGLSMLIKGFESPNRKSLSQDASDEIISACLKTYDRFFILLDALDECPTDGEERENVLDYLDTLRRKIPNIRLLVTSRKESDIEDRMIQSGAEVICIESDAVDTDIQKYVKTQISHSRILSRLDDATKRLVEDTISSKADGMFRWAYCQIQELHKLKSSKSKYVREILQTLPKTLDETYERIVTGIGDIYYEEAMTLLRWITFARRPLTLNELAEAALINPNGEGHVGTGEGGSPDDILTILSGLVTVQGSNGYRVIDDNPFFTSLTNASKEIGTQRSTQQFSNPENDYNSSRFSGKDYVQLAHFSVKEYLESPRILATKANAFHLVSTSEHKFLTYSCLTYLVHYSKSVDSCKPWRDHSSFPLLKYSTHNWTYHSALHEDEDVQREICFFQLEGVRTDWLRIYEYDMGPGIADPPDGWKRQTAVYCACFTGIANIVKGLLLVTNDVDTVMEGFPTPLQVAAERGDEEIVEILVNAGADINAYTGGLWGNPLQAAAHHGHERVVEILINAEVDVNAKRGGYGTGTALYVAVSRGDEKMAQMLLDAGADVNAQEQGYGNALEKSSHEGNEKIVNMLLNAGADPNSSGVAYGTSLWAASLRGHEGIVRMLLNAGADVNAQGVRDETTWFPGIWRKEHGTALQAAASGGHKKLVQMLINVGADANVRGGEHGTALQAAVVGEEEYITPLSTKPKAVSFQGYEEIVQMLLEADADVNAQGGKYNTALRAACEKGYERIVQMLLDAGADVNTQGDGFDSALTRAALHGDGRIVRLLLDKGADVNAQGGDYGSALQAAVCYGHDGIAQILIGAGADVNVQGGYYGNALAAALKKGHRKIIRILRNAGAVEEKAM